MTAGPSPSAAAGAPRASSRPRPGRLVVVGAGPGLGLAVARRFAREGWSVGLVARDGARLARHAAEALGPEGAYDVEAGDAAEPASLRSALESLARAGGPPRVLVHNPSVPVEGPPSRVDLRAYERGMAVGASAFLVALQAVLPAMRAARGGTVLVTGNGLALRPHAAWAGLAAQKAALRSLALSAAQELEPEGIHVATVTVAAAIGAPGAEPDAIAEHYWRLHSQPAGRWDSETVVRPGAGG